MECRTTPFVIGFKENIMSKACQLFSSSKGNSIYISSGEGRFLIDAGVSAKRLENALRQISVEPAELDGIFITHEHGDHIKGLRVFASRYSIPVFADERVLSYLRASGDLNDKINAVAISENMEIKGNEIKPFSLSHDSVSCVGYRFNLKDGKSISVCTDTGYVTEQAKKIMPSSDLVFLESNHEVTMLQNGFYSYSLKQRILSNKGHLSNFACGEFASELAKSGTTRFVLAHLSQDNNTPDIARQTTLCALTEAGLKENVDFRLSVSPVENYERAIVL